MKKILFLLVITLSSILLFTACSKKLKIQEGDKVTILYDSFSLNNEIIEQKQETTLTIGLQQSFPILETKLLKMKKGDKKEFIANSKEGYIIKYDNNKIQNINPIIFENIALEPVVGETISLGELRGVILEVTENAVTIDFNEEYIQEPAKFVVEVLNIERN